MFVARALALIAAAVLTAATVRLVMGGLQTAKARAKVKPDLRAQPGTRLRRDPRTGIYHPEN